MAPGMQSSGDDWGPSVAPPKAGGGWRVSQQGTEMEMGLSTVLERCGWEEGKVASAGAARACLCRLEVFQREKLTLPEEARWELKEWPVLCDGHVQEAGAVLRHMETSREVCVPLQTVRKFQERGKVVSNSPGVTREQLLFSRLSLGVGGRFTVIGTGRVGSGHGTGGPFSPSTPQHTQNIIS